jgi:hypothetical protein
MQYLVIVIRDTVDNRTPCPVSRAGKGFSEMFAVDDRGVGENLSLV